MPQVSFSRPALQNENDASVVSEILTANTYEMMLIKMALLRSQSTDLKTAIKPLLAEHQKMDAEFTAYANRYDYAINAESKNSYLNKLSERKRMPVGTTWDNDVINELMSMHKDQINRLQQAQKSVSEPKLKELIANTQPILQSHFDQLFLLMEKVKNSDAPVAASVNNDRKLPKALKEDSKFLTDLVLANRYELQLMELSLKKSNNRDLKDASQHMIEDHRELDRIVRSYANEKGYNLDKDKGSEVNDKIAKWMQKKGGMEWDADIIEELVDIHKDGIDMLQDARNDVKDEELKQIMNNALPTMEMHLKMLTPLKEKVKKPWKNK